jgi:hypothetical protein
MCNECIEKDKVIKELKEKYELEKKDHERLISRIRMEFLTIKSVIERKEQPTEIK